MTPRDGVTDSFMIGSFKGTLFTYLLVSMKVPFLHAKIRVFLPDGMRYDIMNSQI